MGIRVKAKLIATIWGTRYVQEFARVSLPSYLAPGNLPSLADEIDLEVLIMTTRQSRPVFEGEPAFAALESLCPVRFIDIDDLVTTGIYGVTLTLAYARGVMASGSDQVNTCFIFMNADFVLADGALRALARRLRNGERCIMAPSLRVCAEKVVPEMMRALDPNRTSLKLTPREMAEMAFANLHPTVIAKTVTQNFVTCRTHNQIYWQVDRTTLLGRYHLIFMLAIRPEVPMPPVNSYCDYGFVPELVPSGDFSVLDDSDEFFMLELQPTNQEREFLRCGTSVPKLIGQELSKWATREHRRFGEIDVVFHSEDLPKKLPEYRAKLQNFMNEIRAHVARKPINHAGHFYWTSGVQVWSYLRRQQHDDETELSPPPELAAATTSVMDSRQIGGGRPRGHLLAYTKSVIALSYRRILLRAQHWRGRKPHVAIWHHLWVDCELVLGWAREAARGKAGRALLVHESDSELPGPLSKMLRIETMSIENFAEAPPPTAPLYEDILVHVYRANVRQTAAVVEAAARLLKPGGTLGIYIENPNAELDSSNFSAELPRYIEDMLHSSWMACQVSAKFVGGRVKRALRLIERACMTHSWPGGVLSLPSCVAAIAIWPVVAALTAANNLRTRHASKRCPSFCSSVLLSLTKPAVPSDQTTTAALTVRSDAHSQLQMTVDTV